MKIYRLAFLSLFIPSIAAAHIGILGGPVYATKSAKISFAINHGCKYKTADNVEHEMDTLSVKVDIPAGVTASTVRPLPSDFDPKPVVTKTATGMSVTWTSNPANLQPVDTLSYHEVGIKATFDNVPFTALRFTITQVCRSPSGDPAGDLTVVWTGAAEPEPAPALYVTPLRSPGWNKFTLTKAIAAADFGNFFSDAVIVWKGTAAFSKNETLKMLIAMTPGVTPLTADLAAGDEIWVKY